MMPISININTKNAIKKLMESVDVSQAVKDLNVWRNASTNKGLSTSEISKLTKCSQLLQVLINLKAEQKATTKSKMLQAIGARNMSDLYNATYSIINDEKLPLPKSRRIEAKTNSFINHGAVSLLSKKRTVKNAQKSKGNNRKFLKFLLSHENRLDATQIATLYNDAMVQLGYPKMSASGVKHIKSQGVALLTTLAGSQGKAGIKDLMIYRRRERPKTSLNFISLDGWDVELSYKDVITHKADNKKGFSTRTIYGLRHNVVVISDASIDFPIGWFVGNNETSQTIKGALRHAMRFVKKTYGKYYQFKQLKSDTFGSGKLKDSYHLIAEKYDPATVGNSNDKPIEAWFKILNKRCQMHFNWSGYGNQAVTKHNTDLKNKTLMKKMQPSKAENLMQIEEILTKIQEEKLKAWIALFDVSTLTEMTHEEYIFALGEYKLAKCKKKNETYKLSHQGIKIVRGGEKYFYQTFNKEFKHYALVKWNIIEDPEDYKNVLAVSPDGKLKFLLHDQMHTKMALSEQIYPEEDKYQSQIEAHNKGIYRQIIDGHEENYNASIEIFKELQKKGMNTKQIQKLMPIIDGQQKTYLKIAQVQEAIDKSIPKPKNDENDNPILSALNDF